MDAAAGHHGSRLSPTGSRFGRASPPGSRGRISPQNVKGRVSPAGAAAQGRASPFSAKRMVVEREAAKHRRSPTAPDPSALGGVNGGRPGSLSRQRTWANEERGGGDDFDPASSAEKDKGKERERLADAERERRERREQQLQQSQQQQQQPQQLQPQTQQTYGQSQSLQSSISQSQSGGNVGGTQPLPAPKHIVVCHSFILTRLIAHSLSRSTGKHTHASI